MMSDLPIRTFSITEQRILDAKERFDETLRNFPDMPKHERQDRWRAFLMRFDADLKALSWQRLNSL